MASHPNKDSPPAPGWKLWLGALLVIPLSAASGAMIYFGLYRSIVTGQITAMSKGWQGSSSVIYFAENPIWFSFSWALTALMAASLVILTLVMVRLVYTRSRAGR